MLDKESKIAAKVSKRGEGGERKGVEGRRERESRESIEPT